jgi:homoserine O-succinyltransferase
MPVFLKPNPSYHKRQAAAERRSVEALLERRARPSERLTIGLINNMGDGALQATERQFASLLNHASTGLSIDLALYSLPGVTRGEVGALHVNKFYSSAEDLWNTRLDGLIVTGREPLTPDLRDEAYWESFTRTLDWAHENTYASVWSCLAAHAAVLHMDNIPRIRSKHKHFGVVECEKISNHALMDGSPFSFKIPHSRWNGLSEDALRASGYDVLTRAENVGVDTFVKEEKSLFVFFNGHPEYASNTLLLEYKRDVIRFLKGETDTYPLLPLNYFDASTVAALTALKERALAAPSEKWVADLTAILEPIRIESTWHATAARFYQNWLHWISAQKKQSESSFSPAESRERELHRDLPISSLAATAGADSRQALPSDL